MSIAMAVAAPERTRPAADVTRAAPARRSSATVLGLQQAAGNRAVGRVLARCGAGGCSCGGRCADDDLLLEEGQKALARSVAARYG
jgi:hypothetical protein